MMAPASRPRMRSEPTALAVLNICGPVVQQEVLVSRLHAVKSSVWTFRYYWFQAHVASADAHTRCHHVFSPPRSLYHGTKNTEAVPQKLFWLAISLTWLHNESSYTGAQELCLPCMQLADDNQDDATVSMPFFFGWGGGNLVRYPNRSIAKRNYISTLSDNEAVIAFQSSPVRWRCSQSESMSGGSGEAEDTLEEGNFITGRNWSLVGIQ